MLLKPFSTYFNMFTYKFRKFICNINDLTHVWPLYGVWTLGYMEVWNPPTHPLNALDEEDTNMMVLRFYATWP
jgi:hypothetical protein